ncbi:MAG: hypothetical protein UT05_C0007G0037 [Parcubacteria group bacterium GW2011_GWF2_38_76]|nr:MAG: hypothetical protein UT05_C0007G0037 [Parcubacteria group bacterium GW2011_GWF2_38_76]HBM46087.1 hypothetical protein [Patescibacteria group bacterium]
MTVRLYSDIIIFLTAIFFPGWSFFILGAVASYFFSNFYEFLIIAFMVDVIYGFPIPGWYGFRFVFFVFALLVFALITTFKKRVRIF